MLGAREREIWLLLLGDVFVLYVSLWLMLVVRYGDFPSALSWDQHFRPFTILILAWVGVFFISGLYDKHTVVFKKRLTSTVLHAQFFNLVLAVLFFFALPWSNLTPKRNLLIYAALSSLLLIGWRLVYGRIPLRKEKYASILVGDGPEVEELVEEINGNTRYQFAISKVIDSSLLSSTPDITEKLLSIVAEKDVSLIIVDSRNPKIQELLPSLFTLAFLDFRFSIVDMNRLYEDLFDRVPLSTLNYEWFLEHMPQSSRKSYDIFKRAIDLFGALLISIVFVPLLPFIWLAIKIEDGGRLFISQERLGKSNSKVTVYKIRTMRESDNGVWLPGSSNAVTRVGKVLRMLSIDEMPQLFNIIAGEMSLIGPRNDIAGIAADLSKAIPYYNIRYMIRPGITGWAQTHQHYAPGNVSPQTLEEAKMRLAYDLFYIKRRSLLLDLTIALRTFATVTRRVGSLVVKA